MVPRPLAVLLVATFTCSMRARSSLARSGPSSAHSGRARSARAGRTAAFIALLGLDCSQPPGVQERPPGTNRLIHESSPYLLLHARNPVDWFPWGEEAIELARKLDRPIFLSIGYSTCYWCHRMEEDVFEDAAIAALMNEGFISIKVDREERPDLDEIYMTATQIITQAGGWPNSLFLTPDLKPFFAGTYFPPEDRGRTPGFGTVLRRIQEMWRTDRARILESAERISEGLERVVSARSDPAGAVPGAGAVGEAVRSLARSFDAEWGGFGPPPKFPTPGNLFLLRSEASRGDAEAQRMLVKTLRRMGEGALYDHLGGGFHRYATDREWRVPHFEKMLYDNAALAEILVETARLEKDPEMERLARGSLDFVLERLTGGHGAFLSAIDAQTEGREGAFYIWSRDELERILTAEELSLVGPIFGFDRAPNFEGKEYTVYLTAPLWEQAERLKATRESLLERMAPAIEKLKRAREERPFPLVDDKVLADWNGMMIAAMAKAGGYFREPRYLRAAETAASFVLEELRGESGTLLHVWRDGSARVEAFLDDYAFLLKAFLVLHRETGGAKWLDEAERLAKEMEARLRDPRGGYFQTVPKPYLLFQSKSVYDGAILSGNAVAIEALLELSALTGKAAYRESAETALRAFAPDLEQHPAGAMTLALAVDRYHREPAPPSLDALALSVVEASIDVDPAKSSWRRFSVNLSVKEGWHINANPASSRYLIPTEIRGTIRDVVYPSGASKTFGFSSEALSVYDGRLAIQGNVAEDVPALELVYQACDDSRCLSPVSKKLAIDPR
jgi:uncharacterized protein YyaL (SSP411 family)